MSVIGVCFFLMMICSLCYYILSSLNLFGTIIALVCCCAVKKPTNKQRIQGSTKTFNVNINVIITVFKAASLQASTKTIIFLYNSANEAITLLHKLITIKIGLRGLLIVNQQTRAEKSLEIIMKVRELECHGIRLSVIITDPIQHVHKDILLVIFAPHIFSKISLKQRITCSVPVSVLALHLQPVALDLLLLTFADTMSIHY